MNQILLCVSNEGILSIGLVSYCVQPWLCQPAHLIEIFLPAVPLQAAWQLTIL